MSGGRAEDLTGTTSDSVPEAARLGLRFDRLSAGYGGPQIVHDVDLEAGQGEFVGLVGPNGAGKSTLLKAVTGSAQIDSGSLHVGGRDAPELGSRERAQLVAVVPQSLPEPFAFSAREFVAMGRYPYLGRFQQMSAQDDRIVGDVMDETDTLRFADKSVDTLSGGDLQRLTLAQALAQRPEVLLLDEPTSHLDLNHQLQVLDLVRSRAHRDLSVLAVFHDLALAARYSDRIAVMQHGRIAALGPPAEVLTPDTLREVFGVRAVVGSDPVTGTVSVTPVIREQEVRAARRGRVFVLGGSGIASSLMRRLVESGYEVVAAALNDGDVDHAVAEALCVEHVVVPPFGEIGPADEATVASMATEADVCVVCAVPFGRANIANLRAVSAASTPVIVIEADDIERDFAGGEASALLGRLATRGVAVSSDEAAETAVSEGLDTGL